MPLFSSDLYRNFGIGFVAGGLIVAAASVDHWSPQISSPAQAAEPIELGVPAASADFAIEPLEYAG